MWTISRYTREHELAADENQEQRDGEIEAFKNNLLVGIRQNPPRMLVLLGAPTTSYCAP